MLDPNDGGAVLYPEEIVSLLDTGFMPRIEKLMAVSLHVRPAKAMPPWLVAAVCDSVQQVDFVSAAYILESHPDDACGAPAGLLIYLVADLAFAERAARLVTAAVQPLCLNSDPVIDVMIHDATQPLPDHLLQPGCKAHAAASPAISNFA